MESGSLATSIPMFATPLAITIKGVRLESVDLVRGVIMIIMALDHTREFVGNPGLNPTDLATITICSFEAAPQRCLAELFLKLICITSQKEKER